MRGERGTSSTDVHKTRASRDQGRIALTPSEVRDAYVKAHHPCPGCGARHAPEEITAEFRKRAVTCLDCEVICVDDYYLNNDVWDSMGLDHDDGRLHLRCAEKRLGRELTRDDFSSAPINNAIRWALDKRN